MTNFEGNQKLNLTESILNQINQAFVEADKDIAIFEKRENKDAQVAKDFLQLAQQMVQQAVLKGLNNN
ncbi:hypothetical protein [Priestia megaterium]|uniref:hypothetical protein n=1 Tax=Priestia megaterium TaxID=1404 RepID=UPI00203FF567|nr:hypothetical protein [Priestia megaterium]MCM3197190.1 hypothetical protein [Priestia megaterium]